MLVTSNNYCTGIYGMFGFIKNNIKWSNSAIYLGDQGNFFDDGHLMVDEEWEGSTIPPKKN